jgi:hypothetical protein
MTLRGAIEWIAEEADVAIRQIVLDSTYSGRGPSGGPAAPQAVLEQLANAMGFERSTQAAAMECDAVIRNKCAPRGGKVIAIVSAPQHVNLNAAFVNVTVWRTHPRTNSPWTGGYRLKLERSENRWRVTKSELRVQS